MYKSTLSDLVLDSLVTLEDTSPLFQLKVFTSDWNATDLASQC